MVETTLTPITRLVSLGKMPCNPFATEVKISLTCASVWAISKFWADTDAFDFSLTVANADIFALLKPHSKDSTVHFFFMQVT